MQNFLSRISSTQLYNFTSKRFEMRQIMLGKSCNWSHAHILLLLSSLHVDFQKFWKSVLAVEPLITSFLEFDLPPPPKSQSHSN